MKELILTFFIAFMATCCTYERVYIGDVDKMIANQLENNQIEIDRFKKELRELKVEKFKENVLHMDSLDHLHKEIVALNDSIDSIDKEIAVNRITKFIRDNFNDLKAFNEAPLKINGDTPRPLLKLHVCMLESFFIRQKEGDFYFPSLKLDQLSLQVRPSKTIIKKGEKITGRLVIQAESNFESSKEYVRKMILNGQEIKADKDSWKFEITPNVQGNGIVAFELKSEAMVYSKTTLKGQTIIYVQN